MGIERRVRVMIDPTPRAGAENLAIDWMLLSATAGESQYTQGMRFAKFAQYRENASDTESILRFYRWRPTLSLGHFQTQNSIPQEFANADGLAIARRPSGGGAIVHDQEWTYALVIPPKIYAELSTESEFAPTEQETSENSGFGNNIKSKTRTIASRSPVALVRRIHRATVAMLRAEYGVDARLAGDVATELDHSAAEFLCFQRRAAEDVVVLSHTSQEVTENIAKNRKTKTNGAKVLGSAMRTRGGAVLIHGSFLMRRSEFAPELPGVFDFLPDSADRSTQAERLLLGRWKTAILAELAMSQSYSDGV